MVPWHRAWNVCTGMARNLVTGKAPSHDLPLKLNHLQCESWPCSVKAGYVAREIMAGRFY